MRTLWNYIDRKNCSVQTKYRLMLMICSPLAALLGFFLWLLIGQWFLSGWDWLFCFTSYPIIFSWLLLIFYSCRHDFHDRTDDSL